MQITAMPVPLTISLAISPPVAWTSLPDRLIFLTSTQNNRQNHQDALVVEEEGPRFHHQGHASKQSLTFRVVVPCLFAQPEARHVLGSTILSAPRRTMGLGRRMPQLARPVLMSR
jgi:hypothetical protein